MNTNQHPEAEATGPAQQPSQPTPQAPPQQQSWENVLVAMFNGLGQWAQSTNESQVALSIAMQTLAAQVSTSTVQTANLQQNLPANTASTVTAGPLGSI